MFVGSAVRALIFDCEGVIVDAERLWDESQVELFRRRGMQYDRAAVKPHLVGLSLEAGAAWMIRTFQWSDSAIDLAAERRSLIINRLRESARFMDGALECLHSLQHRDLPMAMATALDGELFEAINERLGLRKLFGGQAFLLESSGSSSKEDGALFRKVAATCGWRAHACAVVEDAPAGLRGARAAGMMAIGFSSTFAAEELPDADVAVGDFAALQKLLSSDK